MLAHRVVAVDGPEDDENIDLRTHAECVVAGMIERSPGRFCQLTQALLMRRAWEDDAQSFTERQWSAMGARIDAGLQQLRRTSPHALPTGTTTAIVS